MPNRISKNTGVTPIDATFAKLASTVETGSKEVIADLRPFNQDSESFPLITYSSFSRVIDVCCMAEMLRNFNITSLRGAEVDRFLELQSFFFALESKCLDEAGFE